MNIIICILIICITIVFCIVIINKYRCHHKWKHIKTISVWGYGTKYPDHYLDVCRCAKCGKVKKFKI